MHSGTKKRDVILAQEFKDHLEKDDRQNGAIDQGKSKKLFMERKWIERKYHVQDNAAVKLRDVRMYCNTNQFPELLFSGPHSKNHGARGLSNNYHDPKLGMGVCSICRIPCDCVAFT